MENKKIFLLTVIAGLISYLGFVLLWQLQTTPDIQTFLIDYSDNFEPVRLQETRNYTLRSEHPWPSSGPHEPDEPFLIQIGEDIIYHEKNQGFNLLDDPILQNSLQRINSISGEIVWQQELDPAVRGITNNSKYIYISFDTRKHAQFDMAYNNLISPGAIEVTAYDIGTGATVWSGIYNGFSYISYMDANEEIVAIHGHNGHYAFPDNIYIDAHTGNFTEEKLAGFGSDINLPSELSEMGMRSLRWEELSNGNFVVATGGRIFAYDPDSKSTLWEINTGLNVTDFAVDQGTIFFLTEEAILSAVDQVSGQEIGKVQFIVEAFSDDGRIATPQYLVSADAGTITIFSRDTQYLFTFRFLN